MARVRLAWVLPAVATITWVVYVAAEGHLGRVLDQWAAAVTMVFGSFVAGSTPAGGGAVAFPVFTKVLEIPPAVARTFSLSIQATGMVMASATILLAGRRVDRTALTIGTSGGMLGFVFGAVLLGDRESTFWSSHLDPAYVKVTFTMVIAAMAYIVFLSLQVDEADCVNVITGWNRRSVGGLLFAGLVGGVLSSLTGSGVNILLFLFTVIVFGLHPRVGVPTSIISMAVVSVLGFVMFGLIDGQLDLVLDGTGDVVSVGGSPVSPLDGGRHDVFGIWLAAIPVVVWGAPLGAWVASVLSKRALIVFVGSMALLEVATTIVFLDQLRSDAALAAYFAIGTAAAIAAVHGLARRRHWFGTAAPTDPEPVMADSGE
ncbi:MAG: sulfite exporter TauE/SafE family protein [Acidimicrobiia bacterium]|nr:sulfite exporter TauE/SafE family protein [Acidimicrobiia bacterium]